MKVSWDDEIPNIWKNEKLMFQTTNQFGHHQGRAAFALHTWRHMEPTTWGNNRSITGKKITFVCLQATSMIWGCFFQIGYQRDPKSGKVSEYQIDIDSPLDRVGDPILQLPHLGEDRGKASRYGDGSFHIQQKVNRIDTSPIPLAL